MGSSTNAAALRLMLIIAIYYYSISPNFFSLADDASRPLFGTKHQWPYIPAWAYGESAEPDLARLLDVGACWDQYNDSSISYVPPLDGTDPLPQFTLCLHTYAMNFVLFDLQLVNLMGVDAIGGTFTAQLQMVLYWFDTIGPGSNGTYVDPATNNCSFLCDTTSPASLCCDEIWVPPLRLPGCTTSALQSITPTPYLHWSDSLQYYECFYPENLYKCSWRRVWYLNIEATCAADMNFHNFPYDLQELTINVVNPYASRTWFQLNKGFLKNNVGEGIDVVNLSPDDQISGWYIKDLIVSSSCGKLQTWQQSFLAQDDLLLELSDQEEGKAYTSQHDNIRQALDPKNLQCAEMKDVGFQNDDAALTNPANREPYNVTVIQYKERIDATLEGYRACVEINGKDFYLSSGIGADHPLPTGGSFSDSEENINRTFGLLDLRKEQPTKVWFPCAIEGVANLTTPGIQITILVKRYRTFYVVKLILPTIACVAFSLSAFGLQPSELLARLSVVVPSAIALTALQALVVATDIPPIAYMAPTTYIILISYLVQLLISFESIAVNWLHKRREEEIGSFSRPGGSIKGAPQMNEVSDQPFQRIMSPADVELQPMNSISSSSQQKESNQQVGGHSNQQAEQPPATTNTSEARLQPKRHLTWVRKLDLLFMVVLSSLYIVVVTFPWLQSRIAKTKEIPGGVSMWKN